MARSKGLLRQLRDRQAYDVVLPSYLLCCLLFGGASAGGFFVNAVLQVAGLAIITWHAVDPKLRQISSAGRFLSVLFLLFLVWTLMTLIPLPASTWSAAGGRRYLLQSYSVLHISPPTRPLTLDPDRTIASALAVLPFAAMLVLTLSAADRARVDAMWTAVAVAVLSILIGAMQLLGGSQSPWYFYRITNLNSAVGFFANSNHLATFFLMTLPFTAALAGRDRRAKASRHRVSLQLPLLGAFLFILFGLVLNGSVAGLLLLLPAVLGSVLIYRRGIGQPLPMRPVLSAVTILAAIVLFLTLGPLHDLLLDKALTSGTSPITRETSMKLTAEAAGDFLPFGSGLGTFRWLYTRYEDPDVITVEYMNHTHNDYLEVFLELGVVGVCLIAGILLWFAFCAAAVWKGRDGRNSLARAGSLAFGMVLLHSTVDYPARTAAIGAMTALSMGLMQAPQPRRASKSRDHEDGKPAEDQTPRQAGRHLSA